MYRSAHKKSPFRYERRACYLLLVDAGTNL